jgi:hypothetical protein
MEDAQQNAKSAQYGGYENRLLAHQIRDLYVPYRESFEKPARIPQYFSTSFSTLRKSQGLSSDLPFLLSLP